MNTSNNEFSVIADKISQLYVSVKNGNSPNSFSESEKEIVFNAIQSLDAGQLRVASYVDKDQKWVTQAWVKEAILLYFQLMKISVLDSGDLKFYDKIPLKKWSDQIGVRAVPPAVARYGSYLAPSVIMMPSFVNIGAYVGAGTMVDTWATVGSCAQIGKNVHLSGGVGIGGVLEPLQAQPVIVEDNVFIGSRCIVVEGVLVEEGAVLGAGVVLTSSTKIVDVTNEKEIVYKGRVPKNSVVIPGTQMKEFPAGTWGVPCALIIGKRTESTDKKTSLTAVLRDFQVSV